MNVRDNYMVIYYGVTRNSGHSKLLEDFQKPFAMYANTWDQKSYIQLGLKLSLHLKYTIQAAFYKE